MIKKISSLWSLTQIHIYKTSVRELCIVIVYIMYMCIYFNLIYIHSLFYLFIICIHIRVQRITFEHSIHKKCML